MTTTPTNRGGDRRSPGRPPTIAPKVIAARMTLLGETEEQASQWIASVSKQRVHSWWVKYGSIGKAPYRVAPCPHGDAQGKHRCKMCVSEANRLRYLARAKPIKRCIHNKAVTVCEVCRVAYYRQKDREKRAAKKINQNN